MGKCSIQFVGNAKRRYRFKWESREIRGEKPSQREEVGCLESGWAWSVRCQLILPSGLKARFKDRTT
jgi:hypothetical protein